MPDVNDVFSQSPLSNVVYRIALYLLIPRQRLKFASYHCSFIKKQELQR